MSFPPERPPASCTKAHDRLALPPPVRTASSCPPSLLPRSSSRPAVHDCGHSFEPSAERASETTAFRAVSDALPLILVRSEGCLDRARRGWIHRCETLGKPVLCLPLSSPIAPIGSERARLSLALPCPPASGLESARALPRGARVADAETESDGPFLRAV